MLHLIASRYYYRGGAASGASALMILLLEVVVIMPLMKRMLPRALCVLRCGSFGAMLVVGDCSGNVLMIASSS